MITLAERSLGTNEPCHTQRTHRFETSSTSPIPASMLGLDGETVKSVLIYVIPLIPLIYIGLTTAKPTPERPMRGGINFTPFKLLSREVISKPDAEFAVIRLKFALPDEKSVLGLEQPTTHVKIRIPKNENGGGYGFMPRARTFSLISPADVTGYFEIAVKVHPGGRVSPFLNQLAIGEEAMFAHTLTKRLAAPLEKPDAQGRYLAIVVFGIGSTEILLMAKRALLAGQNVSVLFAVKTSKDVVFLKEFAEMALLRGPGKFKLTILVSREEPSASLVAELDSLLVPGAARSQVSTRKGRVDAQTIALAFRIEEWTKALANDTVACLAVGSKPQIRESYRLLKEVGIRKRLLGRPIAWGFW